MRHFFKKSHKTVASLERKTPPVGQTYTILQSRYCYIYVYSFPGFPAMCTLKPSQTVRNL